VSIAGFWPFRRRQTGISREDSLNSVPVHNQALSTRLTDAGEVEITVPRQDAWWVRMLSKVLHVPLRRKIVLDEVGSFVWQQCDGSTTVRELVSRFAQRFKLSRREAEVSLTAYLKILSKRRLVGFAFAKAPGRESASSGSSRRKRRKKK